MQADRAIVALLLEYGGILLPHPAEVTTVEFGDVDGRTVFATTCVDGNTRLWDPGRPSGPRVQVEGRIGDIAIVERVDGGIDVVTGDAGPMLQRWSGESGSGSLDVDVTGSGPVRRMKWAREPTAAVAAGYLDGRLTALTSYLGNVSLWRLDEPPGSAELLQEHAAGDGLGTAALFVGQGRALFARSGWSELVSVVDAATGKARRLKPRRKKQDWVLGFHAGSEHVWLATANDETVTLHDVAGVGPIGRPLPTLGGTSAVALGSFDGSQALAVLSYGALRLWDPRSYSALVRPSEIPVSARRVAWAHLGDRDVLLTMHFAPVRVWNPHTGRKLAELPLGTSIDTMAVHSGPQGRVHVAIGGPGLVFTDLHEAVVDGREDRAEAHTS
ncbi:MAG: WD40 repeat domain-containing protein [Nocardioides sp.]|nr:WD40 repeat domain-containing protein [Nocardioides sp.]